MPKRSLDVGPVDPAIVSDAKVQIQRKTERSHEENQERAYIAASRRADRSIEARVQSARMASEIHKKRTGKGFRITEEIVMKEEMYEEEEDSFPRSYRLLGPHMQTASSEMNSRVEAYLSNKVAMSAMVARNSEDWARENEINRLFAQSFPNAGKQAQRLSQQMSSPPAVAVNSLSQSSTSPTLESAEYQPGLGQHDRKRSRSGLSPTETRTTESALSPHALTSPSDPDTPQASIFGDAWSMNTMDVPDMSSFTSDLSAETKMFFWPNINNITDFDTNNFDWINSSCSLSAPRTLKPDLEQNLPSDIYDHRASSPLTIDAQAPPFEEPFDNFINDVWANEQ